MKTAKTLSLLLCFALSFIACKKDKPDNHKNYLTKITTSASVISFTYNSEGRLVKEETAYTSVPWPTRFVEYSLFNAQGLPQRATHYNASDPGNKMYQESEYDSQNRITKRTSLFNEGGTLVVFRYATFTYSGNLVIRRYYDNVGVLIDWSEYSYDNSGNLIFQRNYNESGVQMSRVDYTSYDDKRSYKEFISPFSDWKLEIAKNNPLSSTATFPASGGGSSSFNYTYAHEYNQDGYVTKSTETLEGVSTTVTYEYEKR
ncbi:hypothetical protein [Niabella aquatica]